MKATLSFQEIECAIRVSHSSLLAQGRELRPRPLTNTYRIIGNWRNLSEQSVDVKYNVSPLK